MLERIRREDSGIGGRMLGTFSAGGAGGNEGFGIVTRGGRLSCGAECDIGLTFQPVDVAVCVARRVAGLGVFTLAEESRISGSCQIASCSAESS